MILICISIAIAIIIIIATICITRLRERHVEVHAQGRSGLPDVVECVASGVHKGGLIKGGLTIYVLSLYYYCETPLCELPIAIGLSHRAPRRVVGAGNPRAALLVSRCLSNTASFVLRAVYSVKDHHTLPLCHNIRHC